MDIPELLGLDTGLSANKNIFLLEAIFDPNAISKTDPTTCVSAKSSAAILTKYFPEKFSFAQISLLFILNNKSACSDDEVAAGSSFSGSELETLASVASSKEIGLANLTTYVFPLLSRTF